MCEGGCRAGLRRRPRPAQGLHGARPRVARGRIYRGPGFLPHPLWVTLCGADSSPKRLSSSQTQGPTFNREKRVLLLVLLSEELLGVKDPIPPPLLMSE